MTTGVAAPVSAEGSRKAEAGGTEAASTGQPPAPQPGILAIAPYQPGKAAPAAGSGPALKLSSNENPFGPSLRAVEAWQAAARQLHRYPSADHAPLRAAIAARHGLDPARVICGAGSDEILNLLAQAYVGPGDETVMTEYGFLVYPIITHAAGGEVVVARDRTRVADPEAILAAVTARTRLVFLANPNNPTGTMLDRAALARLSAGLPGGCLLVLDGAYAEFAPEGDGALELAATRANVFVTRTFSKLYGLGGARVGWGAGAPEVITVLDRIRPPFNLGEGQMAAAIAALGDTDHVTRSLSENARLRAWLRSALLAAGIACDASSANFLLARFTSPRQAQGADAALQEEGIMVRRMEGYGLPHALRITVGDEAGCRRVAHVLTRFMAAEEPQP